MNIIKKLIRKATDHYEKYDRHQGDSGPRMFDGCNRKVNSFINGGEFDYGGRR